jgi:hypothetical protein
MGLWDVLNQYQNHDPARVPPQAGRDFESVAREIPPHELSAGLEDAFRSEQTPPFEQMVRQLFEHSNTGQRAGLLDLFRREAPSASVSPQGATNVPPEQVQSMAAEAAKANPSIMQRVSQFYAEHPQVVQMLGNAALAVVMNRVAMRRR